LGHLLFGILAFAVAPSDHGFCKFPYALSMLDPPPFCPISPEPVPMPRTGQRFFTCYSKICHCEEQAWGCAMAAPWQSQGMPLSRYLFYP